MSVAIQQEQITQSTGSDLQSLLKLTVGFPVGTIVAISEEQKAIVASGEDLDMIYAEAREKGEDCPLIWQIPDPNVLWA